MANFARKERVLKTIFITVLVPAATAGFLATATYLFIWSASEPAILFPARGLRKIGTEIHAKESEAC